MDGDVKPEPTDERRQFVRLMQEMNAIKDLLHDFVEQQKGTNALLIKIMEHSKGMEEDTNAINSEVHSINSKLSEHR